MNPFLMTALVILAIAATLQYFLGTKKNRLFAARISRDVEEALKPRNTNYVNIGGNIGYNFTYAFSGDPWTNAKGTITLRPRHSLLYYPVSKLLFGGDKFYINLFTKRKLSGEGHIIEKKLLRRTKIDSMEKMETSSIEIDGKTFVLLWRGKDLLPQLRALLEAMPRPLRLRHFCVYDQTKTFFIHTSPKNGSVDDDLAVLLPKLGSFYDSQKEKA